MALVSSIGQWTRLTGLNGECRAEVVILQFSPSWSMPASPHLAALRCVLLSSGRVLGLAASTHGVCSAVNRLSWCFIFDIFLVWKPFLAIPCCAVAPLIAHGDEVGFVYFGAEVLVVTSAALKENQFPRAWCVRQSDMLISWYHPCKSWWDHCYGFALSASLIKSEHVFCSSAGWRWKWKLYGALDWVFGSTLCSVKVERNRQSLTVS